MRQALEAVLERLDGVDAVTGCADGDTLLAAVEEQQADVVVTDMRMPPSGDREGIRIAHRLRQRHPRVGVVVLTQYAEPRYGLELLEAGTEGRGYLLKERVKDPRELHAAIEAVAHGGSVFDPAMVRLLVAGPSAGASALDDLTAREREVLGEIAQGKSNAAIAGSLVLTKRAVEKHINVIFMKLGLAGAADVSKRVKATLLFLAEAEGAPVDPGTR
jgi:DNA-binding NarL/FixJ family response regulator